MREIRERKQAAQAAYEEAQRLDNGARRGAGPGGGARPSPATGRARRGANREAIVVAVGERPGATAREISEHTGVARNTVASTLTRLAGDGVLERSELPAGGVGFRPARAAATD